MRWRGLFCLLFFYNSDMMAENQELQLAAEHLRVVLAVLKQQQDDDLAGWLEHVNMHLSMASQLINSIHSVEPTTRQTTRNGSVPLNRKEEIPAIETLDLPLPTFKESAVVQNAHAHEASVVSEQPEKIVAQQVTSTVRENLARPVEVSPAKNRQKQNVKSSTTKQTIADAYIAKAPTSTNDSTRVDAVLGERMQPLKSIQKGMTVNDRLRFAAALFNGDRNQFANLVQELDLAESLPIALNILHGNYKGDPSVPELQEFILLVERRFVS